MRLCYVLLSPTFGMHQYTAHLADRMIGAGHEVHLVTTAYAPRDRCGPGVQIHAPVDTTNTGLSTESLRLGALRNTQYAIRDTHPDVVHFTGPHLWDVPLLWALRRAGVPTVHTIHDLDPHSGTGYGRLLHLWNGLVVRTADHVLVHGERYRQRLLSRGVAAERVTCTPLLFPFVGHAALGEAARRAASVSYEPWALFFGRLERYKGVGVLLEALAKMGPPPALPCEGGEWRLVIAGPGSIESVWSGPLPTGVEVRDRLIGDAEAIDLFARCAVVVLPYLDATQSAQIAPAYAFRKPVIVTRAGALPEYVEEGRTGWVVPPGDVEALARCLGEALSDPARLARLGAAGRAWYEAQLASERETLADMYERVATGRSRAS